MIYDEHGHVIEDDHSSVDKIKCECCGQLYPITANKCPKCGHKTEYQQKHSDFVWAVVVFIICMVILGIDG